MPTRITTNANHTAADFGSSALSTLATATDRAATHALRRVGGTAVEWGRKSGAYLNAARIALASLPDARLFGRAEQGSGKPDCGIVTLIDSSGSMDCAVYTGGDYGNGTVIGTRREVARAIAVGITAAARRCGLASLVGHHGASSHDVKLAVHRSTKGVLRGPNYGGNLDAWAVSEFLRLCEMPAERTVFVLVCDGAPNGDPAEHRAVAAECIATMRRKGVEFVMAYIGHDQSGLDNARADWGAARVADCRKDMTALTGVMIRAIAAARR